MRLGAFPFWRFGLKVQCWFSSYIFWSCMLRWRSTLFWYHFCCLSWNSCRFIEESSSFLLFRCGLKLGLNSSGSASILFINISCYKFKTLCYFLTCWACHRCSMFWKEARLNFISSNLACLFICLVCSVLTARFCFGLGEFHNFKDVVDF